MEEQRRAGLAGNVRVARHANDLPIATYSLALLNLVLFFGCLPGSQTDLANRYGVIPDHFQLHSLFTSIFLHFDPAHLLINTSFLVLIGRKVERTIGPVQFLLFYIGSGIVASLLHVATAFAFLPVRMQSDPVVGASGAVSGVLGMYAIWFRRETAAVGRLDLSSAILLLGWLLLQVAFGIAQVALALDGPGRTALGPFELRYVGYWSHIGGFVFGMAAAWLTTERGASAEGTTAKRASDLRKRTLFAVAQKYEDLVAADSCDPFGYSELGRVQALLGNQSASAANYLTAIELYRREGRREEALMSLREALRFWPEATLPHDAVFRFASYLEALGEHEEAANQFAWLGRSARGKPEGEMALLKLGQIELDRLHHRERAIEAIEQLLKEYPGSRWADLAGQLLDRARSSPPI